MLTLRFTSSCFARSFFFSIVSYCIVAAVVVVAPVKSPFFCCCFLFLFVYGILGTVERVASTLSAR